MLAHAAGDKVSIVTKVGDLVVHREAVGDNGATVCCLGLDTMNKLGVRVCYLLATEM